MQYGIINWVKLVAEKRLKLAELPETSIVFLPPGAGKRSFHAQLFAFCRLSNLWLYARAPPRCYRSPGSAERAGHSARLSCSPLMSRALVADRVPDKTLSTRRSICTSAIVPVLPAKDWLAASSSTTSAVRIDGSKKSRRMRRLCTGLPKTRLCLPGSVPSFSVTETLVHNLVEIDK